MSEAEYAEKRSRIESDFKKRLDELAVLIDFSKGRGNDDANTGPFDPASSEPLSPDSKKQVQLQSAITDRLEKEGIQLRKQMADDLAALKQRSGQPPGKGQQMAILQNLQ